MDYDSLADVLYNEEKGLGKDLRTTDTTTNHFGYYTRLSAINSKLDTANNLLADISIPLLKAESDKNTWKTSYDTA
jgi:hypothetical protein